MSLRELGHHAQQVSADLRRIIERRRELQLSTALRSIIERCKEHLAAYRVRVSNDRVLLAHQTMEGRWRNGYISDNSDATGVVEKMPTPTTITDDDVCSICIEGFQGGTGTPKQAPCGHVFHQNCLAAWLSKSESCPLCRRSATTVDDSPTFILST